MSRIGKQPIPLPSGVAVTVDEQQVTVNGPKGNLTQAMLDGITVTQEGGEIVVGRVSDEAIHRAKHGLMRSLISNMVTGVSQGFSKELEVNGVGYRAQLSGTNLKLNVGFSHDVLFAIPQGIQVTVNQNVITIAGIDKQQVGQVAAEIRAIKKPEPYKGKGIKYVGERIVRKAGKSGKDK
jgi:large subunit ribosomal protein L6